MSLCALLHGLRTGVVLSGGRSGWLLPAAFLVCEMSLWNLGGRPRSPERLEPWLAAENVVIVSMVVFLTAGSVSWSGRVGNRRVSNWRLLVAVIAQCILKCSSPSRPDVTIKCMSAVPYAVSVPAWPSAAPPSASPSGSGHRVPTGSQD